jgi:hypothetical protein
MLVEKPYFPAYFPTHCTCIIHTPSFENFDRFSAAKQWKSLSPFIPINYTNMKINMNMYRVSEMDMFTYMYVCMYMFRHIYIYMIITWNGHEQKHVQSTWAYLCWYNAMYCTCIDKYILTYFVRWMYKFTYFVFVHGNFHVHFHVDIYTWQCTCSRTRCIFMFMFMSC